MKIRDKKTTPENVEQKKEIANPQATILTTEEILKPEEELTREDLQANATEKRGNRLTIGQKIMESVKKFFEEVE